ncbi:MAG: pyridoxal phosphate-dependent aminotransferase family protein [Candidatus Obscuribacter sp.]|nr:pyridoxal phosphate-dependent aminotransferase family protein [Candidatus Melainabacteria bacterium]MDX1985653.1 pyridoxal phosphate-dependent aminotransferase family protein [Candidatus Obscuribacter sp.]
MLTPLDAPYVICQGQSLINFASNDYLGLSNHPLVKEEASRFLSLYGAGSPSSRLVTGNIDCYDQIERKLAIATGFEAALLFPTGYQLNASVLPSILTPGHTVFADAAVHRSILEGLKLARCHFRRFNHLDNNHDLKEKLQQFFSKDRTNPAKRLWLAAESVYSVDGSIHDIEDLTTLARQYDAKLFLDDGHALGVFGHRGLGLAAGRKDLDIAMGCFSKGAGTMGGYLLTSRLMKEYLINNCPGFIYSTALAPPVLGAISAALSLIPEMDEERANLIAMSNYLRQNLKELGFQIGPSRSNIISIFFEGETMAVNLSQHLEANGILLVALRPPTTEKGVSALRISLTCKHKEEHIERLLKALATFPLKAGHLVGS